MLKRDFTPTSTKIAASLKDTPQFKLIDPKLVLDEGEKWSKLYDEIIVKQAR
jgi:iron(III) transport system substrate-binding protein